MLPPVIISSVVLTLVSSVCAVPKIPEQTVPLPQAPKRVACDSSIPYYNKACTAVDSACIPDPESDVVCTLQFPPGPCFNGFCAPLIIATTPDQPEPHYVRCGGFRLGPSNCPDEANQVCVGGVNPCIADLPGYCVWKARPTGGPVKDPNCKLPKAQ